VGETAIEVRLTVAYGRRTVLEGNDTFGASGRWSGPARAEWGAEEHPC